MNRLEVNKLKRSGIGPVDLNLAAGECTCISGPSGAGKTLLLRALADLDPCTGTLYLDGVSREAISPVRWRARVGLLSSESHWWAAKVGDHFRGSLDTSAKLLGFAPAVMDWAVERLSSGERQRLALLRLLENSPEILLLDEPTANLDPENIQRVEALLHEFQTENGAALLWVSHDPRQIARMAQHHLRMDTGCLSPVSSDCQP